MSVPVPGQAEQERYAQEYEAKQRAYEDALKQAEHYASSKGTMQQLGSAGCLDFCRQPADQARHSVKWLKIAIGLCAGPGRLFVLNQFPDR